MMKSKSAGIKIEVEGEHLKSKNTVYGNLNHFSGARNPNNNHLNYFQFNHARNLLPEEGLLVHYEFEAARAGEYRMEISSSPIGANWTSLYSIKVNDGSFIPIDKDNSVFKQWFVPGNANLGIYDLDVPVILHEGTNTIVFKVADRRPADNNCVFYLDYFDFTWVGPQQFTVKYDYDTNNGPAAANNTVTLAEGTQVNVDHRMTREGGWEHIGWNINPSAREGMSSFPVTKNEILYAIYKKTLKATFHDYEGTSPKIRVIDVPIYNKESDRLVPFQEQNTYDGWTPRGWSFVSNDPNANPLPAATRMSVNTTLYGLYQRTCTVSYNTDGGSPQREPQAQIQHFNSGNTNNKWYSPLNLASAVEKPGYDFAAWKSDLSGNLSNAGQGVWLIGDTVMTAVWESVDITIEIEGEDFKYRNTVLGNFNTFAGARNNLRDHNNYFQFNHPLNQLPEEGLLLYYEFDAPRAGEYKMEISSSPIPAYPGGWSSRYSIKVNNSEFVLVDANNSEFKRWFVPGNANLGIYDLSVPVMLKQGKNTIIFRVDDTQRPDNRCVFYLDYFDLRWVGPYMADAAANAIQYLAVHVGNVSDPAFQYFIEGKSSTFVHAGIDDVVDTIGTKGTSNRKLAMAYSINTLRTTTEKTGLNMTQIQTAVKNLLNTNDKNYNYSSDRVYTTNETVQSLRNLLHLSQSNKLPIIIRLDGINWWDTRPDLWNWWEPSQAGYSRDNIKNVERYGWGMDTAVKVGWRNWGAQMRVAPAPNLASDVFRAEQKAVLDVALPIIAQWYRDLPEDEKYLFAGLVFGSELSVSFNAAYFANGNSLLGQPEANDPKVEYNAGTANTWGLGFAAAQKLGIQTSGAKLTGSTLNQILADYLEFLIDIVVLDHGIDQKKIITHTHVDAPTQTTEYQSGQAGVVAAKKYPGIIPGWSSYGKDLNGTHFDISITRLANQPWAAIEVGTKFRNVDEKSGQVTYEQITYEHLETLFAHRNNRYISLYNWGGIHEGNNLGVRNQSDLLIAIRQVLGR